MTALRFQNWGEAGERGGRGWGGGVGVIRLPSQTDKEKPVETLTWNNIKKEKFETTHCLLSGATAPHGTGFKGQGSRDRVQGFKSKKEEN